MNWCVGKVSCSHVVVGTSSAFEVEMKGILELLKASEIVPGFPTRETENLRNLPGSSAITGNVEFKSAVDVTRLKEANVALPRRQLGW